MDTWYVAAQSLQNTDSAAWDVARVKFLLASGEEIGPNTNGCQITESGHYPDPAFAGAMAFKDSGIWGGRKNDKSKSYWYIGIVCTSAQDISRVVLKQTNSKHNFASDVQLYHNGAVIGTKSG